MLSCDQVEKLLPGLVTGEPMSHDVREHLASCDACRDERDRLASEIADVREDLAALAPSPFLEDAVVDAAHETESTEPTRRPWRYVVVAFVAAAALFLVVLLPRLQDGGGEGPGALPGGEGESELVASAASIAVPPSQGEVAKARDWNERYWNHRQAQPGPSEMAYKTWPDGAPTDLADTNRFLAPVKEARHRYVWGDENGQPGARTQTMATLPSVEGVFFLGNELLAEIGGTLHAGTTGEIIVGDKRWSTTPGTMQGEITVASPDAGGAEARVRVLVSTGYSGTLMLEDPLARALGLHQFEIPGGVEFDTPDGQRIPIEGHRARARVAIPELDFDRVVEVQVVRQRPWMVKRGRRSEKTGLLFRGLQPKQVIRADTLEGQAGGGYGLTGAELHRHDERIEHLEIGAGTFRFVFMFSPPKGGAVPMLPDVPLLGELFQPTAGIVIPRALDFHASTLHVIDVERVRLDGTWEPGAHVTIARVWRGKTAIPSAEAVVQTQVGETGRIAFPRIAGEQGSTLRMLVTTKDGTSTFHDVVVAPELRTTPRLDLSLGADGIVAGPGWTVALLDRPWEGDEATGTPAPERFAALIAQLQWHAGKPEQRDADGNSRTVLTLRAGRDVPWRMVQWVLMAATDSRVQMRRIRVGLTGPRGSSLQAIDLPADRGLAARPRLERVRVRVILRRTEPHAPLVIRPGARRVTEASPWTWDEVPERLRFARTEFARGGAEIHGYIQVPPPGLVTCAEALRLLAAFRAAGFEDVQLEGAPLR